MEDEFSTGLHGEKLVPQEPSDSEINMEGLTDEARKEIEAMLSQGKSTEEINKFIRSQRPEEKIPGE